MGTKQNNRKPVSALGEVLFTRTQRQVFSLLFGNPDRSFYAKEIVRFAGVGIGSVQRELEKLAAAGLLTVTRIGNQKHYQANSSAPIFGELRGIVLKTFGLTDVLREALATLADRIQVAFVFGSVAKAADTASSDIDLLIVARSLSYADVVTCLDESEVSLGRSVNPTLYKPADFLRSLLADSSFLIRVMDQPKLFLIGTENDIPKSGESSQERLPETGTRR